MLILKRVERLSDRLGLILRDILGDEILITAIIFVIEVTDSNDPLLQVTPFIGL